MKFKVYFEISIVLLHTVFGRDLEKDVMSDTSGHFRRFMKSMLSVSSKLCT